jgi:hypothetical protein
MKIYSNVISGFAVLMAVELVANDNVEDGVVE